jgi:hypothetical protein
VIIQETDTEFFGTIHRLVKPRCEVRIATHNLYTGVNVDGQYSNEWLGAEQNRVGELFDHLHKMDVDVEIKIGIPFVRACQLSDDHRCAMHAQGEKWDTRLQNVDKRWPKFRYKVLANSHAKLVLITPHHSIFGGRNLSSSDLQDLSFYSDDPALFKKLMDFYERLK